MESMVRWITRFDFVLLLVISVCLCLSLFLFFFCLFVGWFSLDIHVLVVIVLICNPLSLLFSLLIFIFYFSLFVQYKDQYVAFKNVQCSIFILIWITWYYCWYQALLCMCANWHHFVCHLHCSNLCLIIICVLIDVGFFFHWVFQKCITFYWIGNWNCIQPTHSFSVSLSVSVSNDNDLLIFVTTERTKKTEENTKNQTKVL